MYLSVSRNPATERPDQKNCESKHDVDLLVELSVLSFGVVLVIVVGRHETKATEHVVGHIAMHL